MTLRPLPENSCEFFVEWQIAEDPDTLIDLSADAREPEALKAEKGEVKGEVKATSGS